MAHNPIFPLYYNDFDRSTKDWTDEEVGFFIRLLMHQWAQSSLPVEPERLQRIVTSLSKNNHILREKFVEKNGKFLNERLEEIRAEMQAFSDKQRDNVNKRWAKKNTKTIPNEYQNDTKVIPKDIPKSYLHIEEEDEDEIEVEIEKENEEEKKELEQSIKDYNKILKGDLNALGNDLGQSNAFVGDVSEKEKSSNHEPENGFKNDFRFDGDITTEKTLQIQKIESEIEFEKAGKPYKWEREKSNFFGDEVFMYKICMSKNLEKLDLQKKMQEFIADLELKQDYKPKKELLIHFTNYLNKKTTQNGTTQFPAKPKFKDLLNNAGTRLGELGKLTGKDLDQLFK